jgi:hypothetical protein
VGEHSAERRAAAFNGIVDIQSLHGSCDIIVILILMKNYPQCDVIDLTVQDRRKTSASETGMGSCCYHMGEKWFYLFNDHLTVCTCWYVSYFLVWLSSVM